MGAYRELSKMNKPISKINARFRGLNCARFICMLALLIICTQTSIVYGISHHTLEPASHSSSMKKGIKTKLKLCESKAPVLSHSDGLVEIPTFSVETFRYDLETYEIDKKPLSSCRNGEKPVFDKEGGLSLKKTDFDEEYEALEFSEDFLFETLRSTTLLYNNGYLSVGNHTQLVATFYSTDEFCIAAVHDNGIQTEVEFKTCPFSKNRPVLPKCCPLGMMLGEVSCVTNPNAKWDPGYMEAKTRKFLTVDEVNPVYKSPRLPCNSTAWEFWSTDNCSHEFHPVTDNTIAFVGAYRYWEFLGSKVDWCMDTEQNGTAGLQKLVMFHCAGEERKSELRSQARVSLLYMVNMYIGAFVHLLTTLVYLITWTRQNIHGKTLCSCTASLFFMQMFLGTAHLLGRIGNQRKSALCIVNSIGGQYFMIAAFTWLLVVNFDLWRTFKSIRAEGGNKLKRFLAYSSFGWLFPLLVSTISIALDFSFPCRVSGVRVPEFGEYYCFVAPWAQGLYVYYILGILIALIFVLAVLTLFGLYSFKKDTVNLRSNKTAAEQQNILLFLKLTVVMGLSWVFEVISWAATKEHENHFVWIVFDLYNALSAILIFVIFVCKKTTLNLLEQSLPMLKGFTAALSKLSYTFSGESSVDNTVSTGAGASGNNASVHKKSVDAQATPSVRYTKKSEREYGSTNNALEK